MHTECQRQEYLHMFRNGFHCEEDEKFGQYTRIDDI